MDRPPLPLAKVVVITKDEHDLIGDFLEFYGRLFGRENVVVVDNGSADDGSAHAEAVQAAYREHRALGGDVRVDARPFVHAASFMSEHMRSLKGECEFLLPLETDEFIFLTDRAGDAAYATAREDVHAALRALPDDVSVMRYGAFLGSSVDPADAGYASGAYSRPVRQITRFHDQGWDKIVVRAARFEAMAQWCHHANVDGGRKVTSDRLGLLHFHAAGLRRLVERAAPVVAAYRYADTRAPLDEQLRALWPLVDAPIACGHKVNYYASHLRRTSALRAFRQRLGRLPGSVEELELYAKAAFPEEAVRRAILDGALAPVSPYQQQQQQLSWDELLYHELRSDGDIRVTHVANFFDGLVSPASPASPASQASPAFP